MPLSLFSSAVHAGLFCDDELAALLDDAADIKHMIVFERSLAKVQGHLNVIPESAAQEIDARLAEATIDPASLKAGTLSAGLPVPALVAALRKVAGAEAGRWLHWGATSQDVMDTAQVLQTRACLDILQTRLSGLIDSLQSASHVNAEQLLAGRTRSQIATPITLGYRIAQWAHPLIDAEAALPDLRTRVLKVQFGGASGVNSAIAPDGTIVSEKLALELGLEAGPSWHVNRTPVLALAAWLQEVLAGLAKMAGDLVLLGRSDIAEVSSGTGGGSSTMPQKANPVQAETIQALAQIGVAAQAGLAAAASPAEERDGVRWPLEWHFLPQMLLAAGTALRHARNLADSLAPNAANLSATLEANPEIMAETASFVLARAGVPRAEAKDVVAKAASGDLSFSGALAKHSPVQIDWQAALDPKEVILPCREMSDRIFAKRRRDR